MLFRIMISVGVGVLLALLFGWIVDDPDAGMPLGVFVTLTVWALLWLTRDESQ